MYSYLYCIFLIIENKVHDLLYVFSVSQSTTFHVSYDGGRDSLVKVMIKRKFICESAYICVPLDIAL
jgi:hypothetical protein